MRKNKSNCKRGGQTEPAPAPNALKAGIFNLYKAQQPVGVAPPLGPAPVIAPPVAAQPPVVGAQAQAQPAPDAPKLSFLEKMKALNPGAVVAGKLTDIENKIQATHAEFGNNFAKKGDEIKNNVQEKINGFNNRFMQLPTGGKSKKRARRTKKRARRTKKRSRSSTRRGSAPRTT